MAAIFDWRGKVFQFISTSYSFWAILALVVIRLWLQPMPSSFWLDETGTALLVRGTFSEMLEKCARWAGQPTFYIALLWPFAQLPGQREIVLRIPSLIGMGLATVFVYRIGLRVLSDESARYACLIFAAVAAYYASDARPYAFGLMSATGAMLFLIRWIANTRWSDAAAYASFAALTVYFHFLFSVIFVAHLTYLVLRRHSAKPIQSFFTTLLTGLLVIPLLPALIRVVAASGGFTFISKPRLASIVLDSFPESLYAFLVIGILTSVLLFGQLQFRRPEISPEVKLFLLWAAVPVVGLWAASYVTPVFLPRYFSIALPGLALSVAWVLSNIEQQAARHILVLSVIVGTILDKGGSLTRVKHANEDWRGAMSAVRNITGKELLPVLVRSDFIESASPKIFTDPGQAEFLLAPQMVYPAPGTILPLPIRAEGDALRRLDSMVGIVGDRFLIVSSTGDARYQMWLRGRMPNATVTSLGNFGTVSVDLFSAR